MSASLPAVKHTDGSLSGEPAIAFHLLGTVDYDVCLALQRRLAYEAGERDAARIVVLLVEHPRLITVGRCGSRQHVRFSDQQLQERRLALRWVSRGGGCILHAPGQLAVYPILHLPQFGWSVGEYLTRLQRALTALLVDLRIPVVDTTTPGVLGGRGGPLVACGVTVRSWTTFHGAYVNVNPAMTDYPFVDVVERAAAGPAGHRTMSCLMAERRQAARMPLVRATLVRQLAAAWGIERYHLFTGHPLLASLLRSRREQSYRAG